MMLEKSHRRTYPNQNAPRECRVNKPVVVTEEALAAPVVSPELQPAAAAKAKASGPAYVVLGGLSLSHFLNDTMQSLIPSVYPILKANYALDFAQIGLITLAFQFTTSLLQPVVGIVTDRRPQPYSLAIGMGFTFAGLILLSVANQFAWILLAAATVGFGSAVFHPESSRIARLASGGRYGFAQSVFQVGGNMGTAVGPLLAAAVIVPFGQPSIAWFSLIAFVAIVVLAKVGRWYKPRIVTQAAAAAARPAGLPPSNKIMLGLVVLALLSFSKSLYTVSLSSYYTFFLMEKYGVSTQAAQVYLFVFLAANAAGVFFGGPIGDRIGRKYVIWLSILGALPFALIMPHAGLTGGAIAVALAGFVMSSATAAIIVFAQEMMPHRVGMISGIFFGFSFGVGGLGAAALGQVADIHGIEFVFLICSFLPAFGLIGFLLPNLPKISTR
jgi:FSR family fosmidomycin resistance protein-like MFS transporter